MAYDDGLMTGNDPLITVNLQNSLHPNNAFSHDRWQGSVDLQIHASPVG
jgi:hypothetical protein